MASTPRQKYRLVDELALTTQVDGRCPLCGADLFYKKGKRNFKGFDLAHIYPLNPTKEEIETLKDEERLHEDVNHPDNLVPLCRLCHTKFDKPRIAEEYRKLVGVKRAAIRRAQQREIQAAYELEDDIHCVIDALYNATALAEPLPLEYTPKSVAEKLHSLIPLPTQQKIKHNVTDYYPIIKRQFLAIERDSPSVSDLICSQVKSYYLKQKSLGISHLEIFENIVAWFYTQTHPKTIEAAEIVTSFFIQNCEVFE
jgi:hypothetical protein